MKVLHISNSDYHGGAAVAAFRLHKAMRKKDGIESVFFAFEKSQNEQYAVRSVRFAYYKRRILQLFDGFPLRFYPRRLKNLPFSSNYVPFTGVMAAIRKEKPDIVHFHWVGKGLFRIEELKKIKVPVFWTLHDSFLFTGGCHLPGECHKFREGCHQCPQLGSQKMKDLSSWNFKRKEKTYRKNILHCITLSSWMHNNAQQSKLTGKFPLTLLPNGLDFELFGPISKTKACDLLGLPDGKKIVAFGAVNATGDTNKGFAPLIQAMNHLKPYSDQLELVLFGATKPLDDPFPDFNSHYLGFIREESIMNLIYNSADVLVVPSLIENLSNVILESLAAGTPVVAFDTGGNKDLISHEANGYLAKKFDVMDLAQGIKYFALEFDKSKMDRNLVYSKFEIDAVADNYIFTYQQALI